MDHKKYENAISYKKTKKREDKRRETCVSVTDKKDGDPTM
jgi:hypothetical protein